MSVDLAASDATSPVHEEQAPGTPLGPMNPFGASQWQAEQHFAHLDPAVLDADVWQQLQPRYQGEPEEDDGFDLMAEEAHRDEMWNVLKEVINRIGLTDEKLAMQKGEEEDLLQQLLQVTDMNPHDEASRQWLLQKIKVLVDEQCDNLPLLKRLRGERMSYELQSIFDSERSFRTSSLNELSTPMQLSLNFVPRPGRRSSINRSSSATNPELEEVMEMEALADEIINYLLTTDLPNPVVARSTGNPWKILRGAMGDARLGTMKVYWRVWKSFLAWLRITKGISWPSSHLNIVEYLHEVVSEPCARSHPQSLLQAFAWFEKIGGMKLNDMLSREPLLMKTVDFVKGKLAIGADPTKQAPRLPVVVVAALESFVCDLRHPIYLRYRAFTILFKVWATMRQDDIQHLSPGKLRMLSDAVVGELLRTKTTGATKRVKEVPLIIASNASVTGMPWLQVGMKLIAEHDLFSRNYLLPDCGAGLGSFGNKMAKYAAASAASRQVFERLKLPKSATRGEDGRVVIWNAMDHLDFMSEAMVHFWTEHLPRACMTSWAGLLGVDKATKDLLGRWSPTGSEDYTRTYRLMVKKLQLDVVKAIRAGDERLPEDDIWERLPRFIEENPELCQGMDAKKEIAGWQRMHKHFIQELQRKGPHVPELMVSEPEVEVLSSDAAVVIADSSEAAKSLLMRSKKFVIVYSRGRKFARIHNTESNCHWSRQLVCDAIEVDVADPSMYDARCRICWPTEEALDEVDSDVYESDEQDSS